MTELFYAMYYCTYACAGISLSSSGISPPSSGGIPIAFGGIPAFFWAPSNWRAIFFQLGFGLEMLMTCGPSYCLSQSWFAAQRGPSSIGTLLIHWQVPVPTIATSVALALQVLLYLSNTNTCKCMWSETQRHFRSNKGDDASRGQVPLIANHITDEWE
jgi:hypothetical protein